MLAGTKIGRYEIIGELGRGGMGVVYQAKDPVIGRMVAVKTIRLSEEGSGMSRPELFQRFQTEAQAAGLLAHPNIVVIYDAGEDNGLYYITMELLEGKNLQSRLDAKQRFPLARVLRITEQVCSALQFAHDRKVVHRDIKPANIMMVGEDTIKISDFGTAKILQYGTSQQTSRVMGTLGYISPEQIKGTAVDGRTDIFSLGVMVYEMTTGRKPFVGEDGATVLYKILNEQPTPPQDLDSAIHPGIGNVILRAMAKNPGDRYQSCRAFFADLQDYRTATASAKNLDHTVALSPELRKTVVLRGVAVEQRAPSLKWESPARPVYAPQVTSPTGPPASTVVRWTETLKLALRNSNTAWGIGLAVLAIVGVLAMKGSLGHDRATLEQNHPALQNTSSSAVEAGSPVPYVSPTDPTIGTLTELAVPWSSKKFFFRRDLTSGYVPALVLRLPGKLAADNSYWAFGLDVPFSQCQYEYIVDLSQLSTAYAFAASHPMVGNPCTHSVLDPLQMKEVPGNYLVRGAIVHGWDTRPPYQIEVSVRGNEIRAIRME